MKLVSEPSSNSKLMVTHDNNSIKMKTLRNKLKQTQLVDLTNLPEGAVQNFYYVADYLVVNTVLGPVWILTQTWKICEPPTSEFELQNEEEIFDLYIEQSSIVMVTSSRILIYDTQQAKITV